MPTTTYVTDTDIDKPKSLDVLDDVASLQPETEMSKAETVVMRRGVGLKAALRRFARENRVGLYLATISFALGLLWLFTIRPFDAPDEPAHFQAVMQVRMLHILPEVHYAFLGNTKGWVVNTPTDKGAYDYLVSSGVSPDRRDPMESYQAPLYYIVAGILLHLVPPKPELMLYLARLLSTLFGAGVVFFCWAAVRQLAPNAPVWAAAAAGVVALLPQFCFNIGSVSNDSLVNMLAAASFCVWLTCLRNPAYDPWMIRAGVLVGLAMLTKSSAAGLLPGIALVILFRAFQTDASDSGASAKNNWLRRGLRMAAGAGFVIAAIYSWWLVRNIIVYGDFTGAGESITMGRIIDPFHYDISGGPGRDILIAITWKSLWGAFGSMNIPMPAAFYAQTSLFSGLALILDAIVCIIFFLKLIREKSRVAVYALQVAAVILVVAVALVVGFYQFNSTVIFQPQGRYLFTLLVPASLVFTGGFYWLTQRRRLRAIALGLPILWLSIMNVVGLIVVRS